MNGRLALHVRFFLLAGFALLCGTMGLSARTEAAIAKDIVNADNGTKLGSIIFPAASGEFVGPSPPGVEFEYGEFTQADITSFSWDLDSPSPFLDLKALRGDQPCPDPDTNARCSYETLQLDLHSAGAGSFSCPGAPPDQPVACAGSRRDTAIEFIDRVPAYACVGFERPLDDGPVTVRRRNLALPLKAVLVDQDGIALTGRDLRAPPVVQVTYQSGISTIPEDVSDQAVALFRGSDSNTFVFFLRKWRYYLKVSAFKAVGTYTISMVSGDETEYRVVPTCEAQFIVEPR
jgi:hypothetical protein